MNGILPDWLEQWLGVEAASPGEGTVWSLENTWSWAPWATLLLAMFAVGWVVYFYAREGTTAGRVAKALLVTMRLALIAIVVFMIAEFRLSLRRTGLPTVAIVVDDSASMGISDQYDDKKLKALVSSRIQTAGLELSSRLNLAKTVLLDKGTDVLAAIERHYRLKLYFVSSAARAQSGTLAELQDAVRQLQPRGESSRLGAGVHYVLSDLRGTPPAAIILLTDGVNTEGESLGDSANYARRKGVPLFTVGLGSEQQVRDLELSDLLVDEVVFVDDVVNFEYKLTGTGFAGKTVDVVLREKDNPTVLAQMKVKIDEDGKPQRLFLPYRPTKVGEFEYVVEVEHLSDEAQAENNRQQRLVSVRKEQIRVLLVQAYPNYEFRYLKNMLERDSTIQLKDRAARRRPGIRRAGLRRRCACFRCARGVVRLRRRDLRRRESLVSQRQRAGKPERFRGKEGRGPGVHRGPAVHAARVSQHAARAAAAHRSGRGDRAGPGPGPRPGLRRAADRTRLGQPANAIGRQHGREPANLAGLAAVVLVFGSSPGQTGGTGAGRASHAPGQRRPALPVFIMQYVGAGKVLFHATDDTWRWRFRVGDVFFARYWVQAVRYLSRSKLLGKDHSVELTADRREYRRGEPVLLRVRFIDERQAPADDDGVTIVLQREGQKNQRVKLQRNATSRGIFEAAFNDAMDGKYHAWVASPTLEGNAPSADFLVAAPPGELERVQMDSGELKRAAAETRGRFYRVSDVDRLLDDLPPGHQVPIETLPPEVLWNRWWLLLAFLGLIVSEWILRKRKGML